MQELIISYITNTLCTAYQSTVQTEQAMDNIRGAGLHKVTADDNYRHLWDSSLLFVPQVFF